MKKIKLFIKNIYFFFEFIFALALLKKEIKKAEKKKNILITPLRGLDNTWIDYLLAIKFSNIYNISLIMMRPSTLPFNEAEKYGLFSTKLMLFWYEVKFFLLKIVLKLKGVTVLLPDNKYIEKMMIDDNNILINTAKDEFFRRYFGNRNYKENPLYFKIKEDVDTAFYNLYTLIREKIKNIDLLWTSHAIYEWRLLYSLALKYEKNISVWGRNVYNTNLISVADGPLQVSTPNGFMHEEFRLDFDKRINGGEIDQPTIFNNTFDEKLNNFFLNNKNVILLTPNCIWDGDISDRDSIFDNLYEWVKYTLDLSKGNNDISVIVRFHPAEATLWKDRPGLWNLFENIELTSNQLLVTPSSKISTIKLAQKANKVIFYSGILALECLHLNIKPFCVSNSFYRKVKGVISVTNKDEYLKIIQNDINSNFNSFGTISYNDLFCFGLKIVDKNNGLRSNPKFSSYSKQVEIEKYFVELLNDKK
ncbi:hypothetical protein OZZ08_06555 [Malaciobacter mytili]|uniref:hypothetical protein n=1 Tax=Malaciobacter mytili TaxID=603050 RepID=UPI003BB1496D